MKSPITQSREWQKLQDALGEKTFFKEGTDYYYLAIIKTTPVGKYLYLPYGPVAKTEAAFKEALISLNDLAKSENAIFVRIEPQDPDFIQFLPKNTVKSKDLNPKDTWVLDLAPDKDILLTNFSQGTRTRYNTFAKKGLAVTKTTEPSAIHHLVELQNRLYKAKNLNAFSENYLKTELAQPFSTLYLVKYQKPEGLEPSPSLPKDGQVISASLFFDYNDTRYYMQSATDQDYKKLPATVALLTTAIFDAKEQGIKTFDFWGIAPEGADESHPWYGFTQFKKSFGGHEVHYAGTYDIILRSPKYKLYNKIRFVGHHLHRSK